MFPLQRSDESAQALTADDVITFDSAVRWLREQGGDDDQTTLEALQAAVNHAEKFTKRTLRSGISRTLWFGRWQYSFWIPKPPLVSVTSVKYYDTANVLQTITASDYAAKVSSEHQGKIEFPTNYSFPSVYPHRSDPIEIVTVNGYTSASCPPRIKQAIRLLVIANKRPSETAAYERAKELLRAHVHRGL